MLLLFTPVLCTYKSEAQCVGTECCACARPCQQLPRTAGHICTCLTDIYDYNLFNYNGWCNAVITEVSVAWQHAPCSVQCWFTRHLLSYNRLQICTNCDCSPQARILVSKPEIIHQCKWNTDDLWHRLINKPVLFMPVKLFIKHAKLKVASTPCRHRPLREVEAYFNSFWNSAVEEGEALPSGPGFFITEKNHQQTLTRRLIGSHGRSGRSGRENNLLPL